MSDLTLVPPRLTKASIEEAGSQYARQLLDAGNMSILDAYMKLRALRDAIDQAIGGLESEAMGEAEQHGRDDRERLGVKFQVRSGRELWDYSHDTKWHELKAQEAAVAAQRKQREQFLKALPQELVDPETGEFISPAVMTGYTKSSLALTFPRGE